jgi:hypothetical protein
VLVLVQEGDLSPITVQDSIGPGCVQHTIFIFLIHRNLADGRFVWVYKTKEKDAMKHPTVEV